MITSLGLSGSAWSCYYTSRTKPKAPYRERRSGHVKCSVSSQNWGIHQKLSADFKPSLYHQDHYQINDEWLSTKHAQKLREVGNLLIAAEREDSLVDLMLVDAIQRLRIDHHFQEEIEALLGRHYRLSVTGSFYHTRPSLFEVSLSFRLLRQEGYYVAPDVFSKYMDENGRFNLKAEKSDIKALTELYEAAQLSIEGEDILDAAAKFSSQLLTAWTRYLDDRDARIIKHNLRHPYRKSLTRFKSMNLMTEFEGINGLGKSLQELSYVENHMAKGIHGQELLQISKWWEDLGLVRELKHARDQPLKWYTWSIACLNDLSFSDERVDLTKTVSFIYLIDDIYDLYGEPEDLHLFTQAVKRWDIAAIQQLPDYMKKCFTALYGITNEAALNIQKKHGFNPIESLRKTWADLCSAFLIESRWFASGSKNMPKADDYLRIGKVSSGVHVVLVHFFFLLGFGIARRSTITLDDAASSISSVATILRLWDDLGSSRDEGQNGHDGSYINYYVNDHEGVPVEFARERVSNMISDEWKRLNMECLRLNQSSLSFQKAILNLARMVPLMYGYNDKHHLPDLQEYIKFTLYDDLLY